MTKGEEHGWLYRATVLRVVDGDTFDLDIDCGFYVHIKVRTRLLRIDTPEIYGVDKNSDEYTRGILAMDVAKEWVSDNEGQCLVRSFDGEAYGFDTGKYGRWLVELHPIEEMEKPLHEVLLEEGFGEPLIDGQ